MISKFMRMSLRKKIALATTGSVVLTGFIILGWALITGRLGGKAETVPISNRATLTYQDESGKSYGPLSSNTVYTTIAPSPMSSPEQWALKLTLQGAKTQATSAIVTISQTGTTDVVATLPVSSDSGGNITITSTEVSITSGTTYDIRVKVNGYLVKKVSSILPPQTTIDVGQLLAGDFNGDNKVFLDDVSIWLGSYKKTVSAGNVLDINQDGKVFLDDLSIFLANYKKIGD